MTGSPGFAYSDVGALFGGDLYFVQKTLYIRFYLSGGC